jgi:hypothetical protein
MPKKSQPQPHPVADQFSDDDMEQMKRFGQALGGAPTDFDEEVEKALDSPARAREASAAKMKAAATGGSVGLGPTEAEQQLAKQQSALQQQTASTGAGAAASAR